MSTFAENPHLAALDGAIDEVFTDMNSIVTDDEKYDRLTSQLIKLLKLREELTNKQFDYQLKEGELNIKRSQYNLDEKKLALQNWETSLKERDVDLKSEEFQLKKEEFRTKPKVSYETLALIGANLAGIVMILTHERANVVATKALGFISKLK